MVAFYYSLEDLSARATDFLNTYILPFISLFSILCGLVCVIVLTNRRLKGVIFQHMQAISIANFFYAVINLFFFIIRCGALCPYGYDYGAKVYEYYIYLTIGKSLELFVILLDLNLLILKLQSFTTKKQSHKADQKTFIMFFLFGVISLVVCIPSVTLPRSINFIGYLVANRTLNYNESETVIEKSLYLMSKSKMSEDPVFNLISLVIALIQGIGILTVLMVINIVILVRLKRFLSQKKSSGNTLYNYINYKNIYLKLYF